MIYSAEYKAKTLIDPFDPEKFSFEQDQWREDGTGIIPIFNGDPRGPSILLKMLSGRTNDWGQRGICVPVGRHS